MEINTHWQFKNVKDTQWLPATVPGTVHTDLWAHKIIPDPFYRMNEKELQWIDREDWEYSTGFEVTSDTYNRNNCELVFAGLDTYAAIWLNDTLLGNADNMFREWRFDVKPLLKCGANSLRIVFQSAVNRGLEKLEALGYALPAANDLSEIGGLGQKKVSVFTRKPGYHFGWDWGPRFATCGIGRPVILEAWDQVRITAVHFKCEQLTDEIAAYEADLEVEADAGCTVTLKISSASDLDIHAERDITLHKGGNREIITFHIHNPRLWWPNGLGEAYLYNITVELSAEAACLARAETELGIRIIRLVQKADADEQGKSFYFEVNGHPVFMKGANYIPNDSFIPRFTEQGYQTMLQAVKAANMNMLRVWGGGFYENDLFYDLCDRNGILIWQDFMFGCSLYPGDKAFLDNVRAEAVQNVKRLRNHPCLALWCGNNEIHVAWAPDSKLPGWGWKQRYTHKQQAEIWKTYDTLFHHLLPETVRTLTHNTPYWPSSPMAADGQQATLESTSGDMHYWGVWHSDHPFSGFDKYIGRFMSEYGFQSFPEMHTLESFSLPADRDIGSEVMAWHQRSGNGNQRLKAYMERYYRVPADFASFVYVSQLLQAEGIRTAIEAHRRHMPYCMGSLYWQLNDCWPVVSWSGIDYSGHWKALHYYARKVFKPVIIAPCLSGDALELYVVSDRLEEFEARLLLQLRDFKGTILKQITHMFTMQANSAQKAYATKLAALTGKQALDKCFLCAELWDKSTQLHRRLVWFAAFKDLRFPGVDIEKKIVKNDAGFNITLAGSALAKNVFLYTQNANGFFADNYFDLLPGETVQVAFRSAEPVTDLEAELKIITLNDF